MTAFVSNWIGVTGTIIFVVCMLFVLAIRNGWVNGNSEV